MGLVEGISFRPILLSCGRIRQLGKPNAAKSEKMSVSVVHSRASEIHKKEDVRRQKIQSDDSFVYPMGKKPEWLFRSEKRVSIGRGKSALKKCLIKMKNDCKYSCKLHSSSWSKKSGWGDLG